MATAYTLEFEKPLAELERQIDELKRVGSERDIDVTGEITTLEAKLDAKRGEIYQGLTPIQRVLVARHPRRPRSSPISSSCTAIASSAMTPPSSAAGRVWPANR
jgi:acetyl-CoA carboxylase carboxyl transferase subunit alpha